MTISTPPDSVQSFSPYSAQVLDTLQNILAPGKRFRISPHIETAQFLCLFDDTIDPATRNQQMHEIFRQHDRRLEELAEEHSLFVSGVKKFTGSYDKAFLDRYMIYYFPVNVAKLQLLLLELLEREELNAEIRIIDIGVGSGTSVLSLFDFLLAWATACHLYDIEFPISSVKYAGVDNSPFCLKYAEQAVQAFAEGIRSRGNATGNPFYKRIEEWLEQCEWLQEDINTGYAKITHDNRKTLLIASNVLNELTTQGTKRIEELFTGLPEGSMGLFIEPGDKNKTTRLNSWRKNLQIKNKQICTVAPCGQEHENFLQCKCDDCWNARRESFFQSPLYRVFREKCSRYNKDKRSNSFDEYQNNLLSWSYYILKTAKKSLKQIPVDVAGVKIRRYVGSFAISAPVAPSHGESTVTSVDEYLKFCPGSASEYKTLVIKRKPGMQCPDLRHGENVNFNSIENAPQQVWGKTEAPEALQFSPEESDIFDIVPVGRRRNENVFLTSYSSKVKSAIDDIAFRLFGFPQMRPFQHTILERVLQGNSILGIAATGGGKSECYILPAMLLPGITIVIAPLISLIQDQFEQRIRDRYGLEGVTTYINSEIPFKERQARLKRLTLGYYKIIYLTPEQLEKAYILNCLQEADHKYTIRYLALDESHCISQWGHDFRPAYLNMVSRLKLWQIQPTRIALTATASPEVRKDLCAELGLNPQPLELGGDVFLHSSNRHELNFIARAFPNMEAKSKAILDALKQLSMENRRSKHKGAAIVFFPYTGGDPEYTYRYMPDEEKYQSSRKGMKSAGVTPFASYIERELQQRVSIYHGKIENEKKVEAASTNRNYGDLSGRTRQSQQKAFIEGDTDIMVATKGFGMGIDKPNIRLVIHRTPTSNLEAYAQEAGRAGRDGEIADCLLFYSPDAVDDDQSYGNSGKIPSDHEIQTRFLSGKYIRLQDMVVMFHFLRDVERKVGEYFYFTNDEVLEFFQKCIEDPDHVGLSEYFWPDFQKREPGPYENEEETLVLEKGHYYQEKTSYVGRILSVAYRVRPQISGKRVSALDELQETGASFSAKKIEIFNATDIVQSNSYFGAFLRAKGLDSREFSQWLQKCASGDFIEFAHYLDISLKETASLFQDIKRSDGSFRNGEWKPRLLNFGAIIPPKYGPALDKNTLPHWRDYAGAKFLNKKAYIEAKKNNRKPTIDERFPWSTMPFSTGWEVKLGSAFDNANNFQIFLREFMQVHEEREKNDWAAYYRLLSNYVGVDKNGQIRENDDRKCLRSVMLGYLKTYEVVEGGNCLSCNVCIPNEKFEIDLEKRKRVVVKLSEPIAEFIEKIESAWEVLPEEDVIQSFWDSVQAEVAAGRSALGYIEGATGRMLDDNPGHIPALYIRLTGMAKSIMAMDERAFVDNANTLVTNCSVDDTIRFLNEFLYKMQEFLPDDLAVLDVQGTALHKIGDYKGELVARVQIHISSQAVGPLYDKNCQALCDLTEQNGPLENSTEYLKYALDLARLASTLATSHQYYQILLKEWTWERVDSELDWLRENGPRPKTQLFIVEKWLSKLSGFDGYQKVCGYLEQKDLVEEWPDVWQAKLFSDMPLSCFDQYPLLKDNYWKSVEIYKFKPVPRLYAAIVSDYVRGERSEYLNDSIELIFEVLFVNCKDDEREIFIEENAAKDPLFPQKLISHLAAELLPSGVVFFRGWLNLFEKHINRTSNKKNFDIIVKLLEHTGKQVEEFLNQYADLFSQLLVLLLPDEEYTERLHDIWMDFCKKNPDAVSVLAFYLKYLPRANYLKRKLLDELCEMIVDSSLIMNETLLTTLESISSEGFELPHVKLTQALEFRSLLRNLKREAEIEKPVDLSYEHFKAILRIFQPERSVLRADMMVTLLTNLRRHLVQSWLTPVAFLVEAYGYAQRFEEAENLIMNYPDLKVGRPKVQADAFLKTLAKKNQELREKTPSADLLDRIAREELVRWQVAQPKRR